MKIFVIILAELSVTTMTLPLSFLTLAVSKRLGWLPNLQLGIILMAPGVFVAVNASVPQLKDSPTARVEFLALIRQMDALLACTDAFRLDTYEARARKRAGERGVRSLRRMFTTWIDRPNSNLNDYAHHQFAGLLGNYYLKRWETFFADPDNADAALDALERSAPSAVWAMPPKNRDILEIIAGIPLAVKYIINDD